MKLVSINMDNFRQYYGENNQIDFNNNDSKITVILGENGCGKTGLFRAMVFALFGITEIEDDDSSKNKNRKDKIHLVNWNKLNENKMTKVPASVTVVLENDNKKYEITRKIYELMQDDGDIITSPETVACLRIYDENGNLEPNDITDNIKISAIMEEIMNPKLKDFFFFNGEKIEQLSKTDQLARATIKNGILKLLQIDNLEKAINILINMQREKQRIIGTLSDVKLQNYYKEKDDIERKIEQLENDTDNYNNELDSAKQQLEKIDVKLKQNEGIKKLIQDIENQKQSIKEKENELGRIKESFSNALRNSLGNSLIDFQIKNVYEKLESKTENTIIPIKVVDEIIKNKKCICGRCFESDSATIELFEKYKREYKEENSSFFKDWIKEIDRSEGIVKLQVDTIKENLKRVRSIKNEIENLGKELKHLEEKYKSFSLNSNNDIRELERAKESLVDNIDELKRKINFNEKDIKDKKEELKSVNDAISKLEDEDNKNQLEIKKKAYIDKILNMFNEIRNNYTSLVKEELSKEMYRLYKELIAEKDKDLISEIIVDDDYKIDVKNWQNVSILQDLSSGQKQVLSLALIISLSKLACDENNKITVPLFMDTPFGRISLENRRKIINSIPEEMEQWVLLATDTELTSEEINYLYETNKWKNAYKLVQIEKGKTIIKQLEDVKQLLFKEE